MNPLSLLAGACLALGAQAPAPRQEPPAAAAPAPGVHLPPGPAARAFAGVGMDTAPRALPPSPFQGLEDPAWRTEPSWRAWAEAVRAEAEAEHADPLRRAKLAQIALAQDRWDDAWDHFAATGGEPGVCAALLPRFLPGVSESAGAGPGGLAAALPDGVLLRPAIPPPDVPAAEVALGRAWIERRTMRIEGLRVGAAVLSMKVALESDGVQIDFEHRSGGNARVRVVLPEPPDFQVRVAYVDWMRQDEVGVPLELELAPGGETRTLFGRFRARPMPWPTSVPERLSRGLGEQGLELVFPASVADAELFRAAGTGLAGVLGLPVATEAEPRADFAGVRIDLAEPSQARRKLLGMVTLAERFALRRAR